ncbi:MAG: PEP-utilizing enzyme [bacterium]|nr:PEP-utilizing enzyme [bacterium]
MNVKQLEKKLSGYKFLPEGGRACFFYPHYEIIRQMSKPGFPWSANYKEIDTSFGSYSKNHIVEWYFISSDEKHYINFIERYIKNPKLLEDLKKYADDLKNKITKLVDKDFFKRSNEDLGNILSEYYDLYQELFKGSVTLRTLDRGIVMSVRQRHPEEKADEILRNITISDKPTVSLKEELDVLNLALKLNKEHKTIESLRGKLGIKKLLKKYAWSILGYYKEQPNTEGTFEKRVSDLMKENPEVLLNNLQERIAEDRIKRDKLLMGLSSEEKKIAFIASETPYLKDYVKSKINEAQYYAEPLFIEIAKRIKKSLEYIKDLMIEEVKRLLAGGSVDDSIIKERTKENFIISLNGEVFVLVGSDAGYINNKCVGDTFNADSEEFKGRVASLGYAKGLVKVVYDVGDFHKVQAGDILVVINTSPDFIPVIRKAGAIVAEEGGLTAHVSVVSREFGVPCIVGVKGATSLLKDGDLVEVNANKGIVRKIK